MAARCPPRSPLIAALAIAFTLSLFQRDRQAPLKSRGTSIRAAAQCRRPGRNGDFTPRKYGCFGNVRPAKRTAVLNGLKGSINSLRGMMYMSQIPMRKEGQSTHSNRRTQRNRRMRRLGPPRMGLFDDDDEEEEDSDEEEDDDLVLSALKSKREGRDYLFTAPPYNCSANGAFMPCGITFHTEKPIRITALRVPFECLSPEFWDGFSELPEDCGRQYIQVIRSPMPFPDTVFKGETLHISEGVEGDVEGWISCDIPVRPGDFVSLFGYRNVSDVYDTLISYGIGPHWERVLGEETGAFMASAFDEAGPIPFQPNEGVRTWVEYNHVDTLNRLEFKYRAMDIEEEENVGYDIDWDEVPAPPEVNFTERNIVILPSTGKRAASKDDLIQMALEYEEGRKLKQQQEEEEARAIEAEYEESYDGDYDYEYYDDDEDEDDDDVYFDEDRDEGPGISGYTEQNLGAGVGDEENYFDSISRAETESNLEAYEDRQDDSDIIFDDDSNDGTAGPEIDINLDADMGFEEEDDDDATAGR